MKELSSLSPEEIEIIVSLPYKAGIYISYAEDEDGGKDDDREMRAMERALSAFAQGDDNSPLIKEIASEILRRKSDWSGWAEGVFVIEPECEKAVKIIKPLVSNRDFQAYIKMIIDITTDVAQAYGEFGMEPEKPSGIMGFVKKMMGAPDDADQPMNVSAAEDDSIARIVKALKKYA